MKKAAKLLSVFLVAAILMGALPAMTAFALNPYLPIWEYIPDGEPYVFEDPENPGMYRYYIYGSHDTFVTAYCGPDQVLWSAPVDDLSNFRYEGVYFQYKPATSSTYDTLYAPDVQERIETIDGKQVKVYYLYPNSQAGGRSTMVAKSVGDPRGPFIPINLNPAGTTSTGALGFDPAVFIDDDGRVYGYWGFQTSYGAELDQNMYSLKAGTSVITHMIGNRDTSGAGNTEQPFRFFEASSMRKVDGAYIFVYARGGLSTEIGGTGTCQLAYAYSFESPLGPFTYGGTIINASGEHVKANGEPATDTSDNMSTFNGHNTHGSIVKIGDQWYITYHRATNDHGYSRQATMEAITLTVDKENKKVTIPEVQMTSEGWETAGLNPYKYYSAGIACYHTGGAYVKANRDQIANSNTITRTRNNSVAGYKFFNFSQNAPEGKYTRLNIGFIPAGLEGFIDVYLDRPNTISGQLLGTYQISAGMPAVLTKMSLPLPALDTVDGKHAIFFVFRHNAGNSSLGDLYDLEFVAAEATSEPVYFYTSLEKSELDIGQKTNLKIFAKYADNNETDVTAQSTVVAKNPEFATFGEGIITGVAAGRAFFDVSYGTFTQTISVNVIDPNIPTSITAAVGEPSFALGEKTTLTVTATFPHSVTKNVTAEAAVTAKNPDIATYSGGIITSVSVGSASFEVTYGSFTKTVTVTVRDPKVYTNFALASNGGVATSSGGHEGSVSAINDGVRTASTRIRWQQSSTTRWVEIAFNGPKMLRSVDLISQMANDDTSPLTYETITNLGLTHVLAYYWNGAEWVKFGEGASDNNLAIQQFPVASPVMTDKIRFEFPQDCTTNGWVRVIEVEAWGDDLTTGDSFVGGAKDSKWEVLRDDAADWSLVKGMGLRLPTQDGDIYAAGDTWKNIFIRPTYGDFTAVAKVCYPVAPNATYQQAALLLWSDADNYIKVEAEYTGSQIRVQAGRELGGSFSGTQTGNLSKAADGSLTIYYRITKVGDNCQGAYSLDGLNYTNVGGNFDVSSFVSPKLGIYATKNSSNAAIDTYFEYVSVLSAHGVEFLTPAQMLQNALTNVSDAVVSQAPASAASDLAFVYPNSYTVTLESSDESAISNAGVVTRGAQDKTVALSITVSNGTDSITKSVNIIVPKANASVSTIANIVAGRAANVPFTLSDTGLTGLTSTLFGKTAEVTDGKGLFSFTALQVPAAGVYTLNVLNGETVVASATINVVAEPAGLWAPVAAFDAAKITVTFGAPISFNDAKKAAAIGAVPVDNALVSADGDVLTIAKGGAVSGQKLVVSGIKYAELFPSYSFSFTITLP